MEELQRLKAMHENGVLSDDEFARRKSAVLDSMLVKLACWASTSFR